LPLEVVDLSDVLPAELDRLWQHEQRLWREWLLWDISGLIALMRQLVARGSIAGKAVRVGRQTVGSAYYVVPGGLGVLAGFSVLPAYQQPEVGTALLRATVNAMRGLGLRRIQSQFLYLHEHATDPMALPVVFEQEGFQTYWRDFLRADLTRLQASTRDVSPVRLAPWRSGDLPAAADVMQAAYEGEIDAQMDCMYQTPAGCRAVLENILRQQGIGALVTEASALARHRGQVVGFTLITEISPRQGHLAQVVVSPAYQHRGIGRALLYHSLSQLKALAFDSLSLLVSRANPRAVSMYQEAGFASILPLPVFVWES
jgi:ribosomal protein S18 acetylase RimI-like enzyme